MSHIKLLLLQIQFMELLQHTINDTITELKQDLNQSTIDKLLIASHSLEIEVMMCHARIRVIKNPNYGEEKQA